MPHDTQVESKKWVFYECNGIIRRTNHPPSFTLPATLPKTNIFAPKNGAVQLESPFQGAPIFCTASMLNLLPLWCDATRDAVTRWWVLLDDSFTNPETSLRFQLKKLDENKPN